MTPKYTQKKLTDVVNTYTRNKAVHELTISILDAKSGTRTHASIGQANGTDIDENTPYCLASTTKLFATTIILQLRSQGLLDLGDPIVKFFDADTISRLHVKNGVDYTNKITVTHLLSHTSGLPDYFEQKRADGTRFADSMLSGTDMSWPLSDVINAARNDITPPFTPGKNRKAFYSDTNFQLLGGIIEAVTGKTLSEIVEQDIAKPLGLKNTFLATEKTLRAHSHAIPLRNGEKLINIPRALESTRLDGGGISTSTESLRFIQAFFDGEFFPKEYLNEMQDWRSIFFPLTYGTGIMRFKLPWFFTPFQRSPEFIGHSGISGAFAFYNPSKQVFLAGTTNQLADRSLPYKLMLQALNTV